MNTSYRESGDFSTVAAWFKNYNYPHCKLVNNLTSLRSGMTIFDIGVAIAEILMDKLPKSYHRMFMSDIEIYNLNPQRSIMNLKILLATLRSFYGEHPEINVGIE